MALFSWTKKLTGCRVQKCRFRLLLSSTSFSPKPLEVVLAANLGCKRCQKRVADTISRIHGVESTVVRVLEEKSDGHSSSFQPGIFHKNCCYLQ